MPRLEIIETPALNAYAAGLREGDYTIAVTRGLLERLEPAEIEAVLAHELTHIRNRDTQLMVIAVISPASSALSAICSSGAGIFPMAGRRRRAAFQILTTAARGREPRRARRTTMAIVVADVVAAEAAAVAEVPPSSPS